MELSIVGAGPAGCTAAVYAGRAGIDTVVFDGALGGGLARWAPRVRNYPGLPDISGEELMERMQKQAKKYARFRYDETVTGIQEMDDAFQLTTSRRTYITTAVILCMGILPRRLDVPGEKEFAGYGVSYGAIFYGPRVNGDRVAMVGGGNAAVSGAIYLRELGYEVFLIHRRNQLRAEYALEQEARKKGVSIILNSVVEEIFGDKRAKGMHIKNVATRAKGMHIKNVATGETEVLSVAGIFISIGMRPRSELATAAGVHTDETGYITTDAWQRTNIKGVYAAGDVTGGFGYILTSCAEGATAAFASLELFRTCFPKDW
jgi:thioredoxin reductase (NADPH)